MNVVFRADATHEIGGGHVMRSLVIARELAKRGHQCTFVATEGSFDLVPLKTQGIYCEQIPESDFDNPAKIRRWIAQADLLFLDSYRLDSAYQKETRCGNLLQATIEDIPGRIHLVDLLIDPTFEREEDEYRGLVPPHCRLLLGVDYAPLREEFANLRKTIDRKNNKTENEAVKILVSLGLTDPDNDTLKVLKGLKSLKASGNKVSSTVVIGKGSKHKDSISAFVASCQNMTLLEGVEDMATLMANSDLAIGAGGSTCWERCCLKLPSLIVVQAVNQSQIEKRLSEMRAVISLGKSKDLEPDTVKTAVHNLIENPHRRQALSEAAAHICDGMGAKRIADKLEAIFEN